MPSKRHENRLTEVIDELKGKGFHVIRLNGKCPDAIATKEGKLIAVEVIGKWGKERRYRLTGGWTYTGKKRTYSMFDDVMIFDFPYAP
jgi:hypothetical protein